MTATEHHLTVPRTARYYALGRPHDRISDCWIVCHGYGQLAGAFLRRFQSLSAPHRLVLAPEGLSRFYLGDHTMPAGPDTRVGASWMTRVDREWEIADYLEYLDALAEHVFRDVPRDSCRLTVLGFSQGAATAARWALRGRSPVQRLILWGGILPPDSELAALRPRLGQLAIALVAGTQDQFVTPKILLAEEKRLQQHGARYTVIRYEGGHEIDEATLAALEGAP